METFTIRPVHYLTCLWPGMSELWWRGRLSALPASIAFAATINALLVAKFVYVQWISGPLVWLAIWVVAATWAVLTFRSMRELPMLLKPREISDAPDRFPEAQSAYLRGEYAIAEEALGAGLSIEPRDPPSLLLLASIYRHTGRLTAASTLMTEMRKLEATDGWDLEWQTETSRLDAAIRSADLNADPLVDEPDEQPAPTPSTAGESGG